MSVSVVKNCQTEKGVCLSDQIICSTVSVCGGFCISLSCSISNPFPY